MTDERAVRIAAECAAARVALAKAEAKLSRFEDMASNPLTPPAVSAALRRVLEEK